MRLLLDTHMLPWFALNDPNLSGTAMNLILDPAHEKFVSPASNWEIAIKTSVGKYLLAVPYEDFFRGAIDDNGFWHLLIEPRQAAALTTLPFHHRDPFDRLVAATALVDGLTLVSADQAFDAYGVTRLW